MCKIKHNLFAFLPSLDSKQLQVIKIFFSNGNQNNM